MFAAALLSTACLNAFAIENKKVTLAELPSGIPVTGTFVAAVTWTDKTGPNTALFTYQKSQASEGVSVRLQASGYRKDADAATGWTKNWKLQDGVENCDLDITAHFVRSSIEVTDLDENGIAEVSFVYRQACNGGMDLVDQKLFLIEGEKKHPIRGATQLVNINENGKGGHYDGPMTVSPLFNQAPSSFKPFAVKKWMAFRDPKRDNANQEKK